MATLLNFVDDVASLENTDGLMDRLLGAPSLNSMHVELSAHARAYNRGIIGSQRLAEILFPPFVKLGIKTIQVLGTSNQNILFMFLEAWACNIVAVLNGEPCPEENHEDIRLFPVLQPLKRAELVKALVKGKLHEV